MKKKVLGFLAAVLCVAGLAGCRQEVHVGDGIITEKQLTGEKEANIVIVTDDDKIEGYTVNNNTIFSGMPEYNFTVEDFWSKEDDTRFRAVVTGEGSPTKITTESGESINAYPATIINVTSVYEGSMTTMADGTVIDVWRGTGQNQYYTAAGTLVLTENPLYQTESYVYEFSENHSAGDKIIEYFNQVGAHYNIDEQITRAYEKYSDDMKKEYGDPMINQSIVCTAKSPQVSYWSTKTRQIEEDGNISEKSFSDVFQSDTGERIEFWQCLNCSQDEAVEKILDLLKITDTTLRQEMTEHIDSSRIEVNYEYITLHFYRGELSQHELDASYMLDFDDGVKTIFQEWAIPVQE